MVQKLFFMFAGNRGDGDNYGGSGGGYGGGGGGYGGGYGNQGTMKSVYGTVKIMPPEINSSKLNLFVKTTYMAI